jgi:predicted dehydrogenase
MKKKDSDLRRSYSRRDFLQIGGIGIGAAVSSIALGRSAESRKISASPRIMTAKPLNKVKVGFVGVGMQGSGHLRNFLNIDKVEITAICDIIPEKVARMQEWVTDKGFAKPRGYFKGEYDFKRMCQQEDLDLVYTATPWNWHVPVIVEAMKNGKHAATEVPAAVSIDECWEMVETAEKYNKHCVMMENCCYSRHAMMVLNMVRAGVFGEILHGAGGYLHDLRNYKLGGLYENDWRVYHSMKRNGNLYPTHGLGPIAQCMGINRGDQFDYLVSMSSNSRGLQEYAKKKLGEDHKFSRAEYALGDVNTTLIKTKSGKTIYLAHDTNLPRPYTRIDLLQGTHGITEGYPPRFHIEGKTDGHGWEPMENYLKEYDHPLWKNVGEKAKGAGHGGMDFLEDYRLVQSLLKGEPTDIDVYDGAAWSVVSGLTGLSVANKSRPIDFPDFTRGLWKKRKPLGIVEG